MITLTKKDMGAISSKIHQHSNVKQKTVDIKDIKALPEYEAVLEQIGKEQSFIFVTGKAGTGKSTMIHYLMDKLNYAVVVAPTARAAMNIDAMTIHRFFGFSIGPINPDDVGLPRNNYMSIIKIMKLLIIDEISMVTSSMIDCIDKVLKLVNENNLPFGGISVLFVGDLFQLPPIVATPEEEKFYNGRYETEFFYGADIFKELKDKIIPLELKKVQRQSDTKFIKALNNIRVDNSKAKQSVDFLNQESYEKLKDEDFSEAITLAPTNADVDSINDRKLRSLDGEVLIFRAKILEGLKTIDLKNSPAPDMLKLKVGAQIVFIRNNGSKWINGSLGRVEEIVDDSHLKVFVYSTRIIEDVAIEKWQVSDLLYDTISQRINTSIKGSFEQFPVDLGWAITIHKSQGMTLDKVEVDLSRGAFAEGQAYVALSRVKSIQGLKLSRKINITDIKAKITVVKFYRDFFNYKGE